MASIKELAKAYEPPQTKNIADLERVSVDIDVQEITRTKTDGEEFKLNIAVIDEQEYRVPNSVLGDLKILLEKKPDVRFFSVVKSGTGMQTKYTVLEAQ